MRVALAAIGFTSTIAQVVLMRELVATLYGNELLFGLVLMAWLGWVAAGSWGLARPAMRAGVSTGTFAALLILAGILLPLQLALVRGLRTLLGVTPGAFIEFGPMVAAVVLLLAPLCLLGGLLFTLGVQLMVEKGHTAGQAYVWESVGAVTGGALFSFLLIHRLDPFQTALLITTANLGVAASLCLTRRSLTFLPHSFIPLVLCSLVPLLLGLYLLGRVLHAATLRWQWPDLVFAADSPYGRLVIQARDGQRAFFENGLLAFETQGTFPEEVAHFPLLLHPAPQHVLLIGGGVAGDLREILKHPVADVTYVELDPLLIKAAQTYLPASDAAALSDARVKLAFADGRLYVKTTRHTFDLVILDLPEPATGALNRFYTLEFFAEVRSLLNPGGILALGLPSAENYWSPELARRNGSVYHTLRAVFPEVLVLPGEHNFFLASMTSLEADPALLAKRLRARDVQTRWVTPEYIRYLLTSDRFLGVKQELEAMRNVSLNRDLTPICYYYDLVLWLSRFYPLSGRAFLTRWEQLLWWLALLLVIAVVLARWRRGLALPILIASTGLAEMMLEVVILFAFQVLHGYVYAEVSLIVSAFMAGLALGGRAALQWQIVNRSWHIRGYRRPWGARQTLVVVLVGLIIYAGILPLLFARHIPAPELSFPLLALLAGSLGGMAFPLALTLQATSVAKGDTHPELHTMQARQAGLLYAADLVGGCLGALLGSALLVPVLGIPQTCLAIALVGMTGLLALL